mmetsp:Transcript_2397/g.5728  ORF Transcript_2397/g.5728 Transcript_2397/m.5728 type:complete len:287 (+) Transcript_2397:578-1438(+)
MPGHPQALDRGLHVEPLLDLHVEEALRAVIKPACPALGIPQVVLNRERGRNVGEFHPALELRVELVHPLHGRVQELLLQRIILCLELSPVARLAARPLLEVGMLGHHQHLARVVLGAPLVVVFHRRERDHHRQIIRVCRVLPVRLESPKVAPLLVDGNIPGVDVSETQLLLCAVEAEAHHHQPARCRNGEAPWDVGSQRVLLRDELPERVRVARRRDDQGSLDDPTGLKAHAYSTPPLDLNVLDVGAHEHAPPHTLDHRDEAPRHALRAPAGVRPPPLGKAPEDGG